MFSWTVRIGLGLAMTATAAVLLATYLPAAAPDKASADDKGVPEDKLKPNWRVGDQWVVETVSQPLQARTGYGKEYKHEISDEKPDPVQWQFSVVKRVKLGLHECFVLEITALPDPKTQPKTTLWVDAGALALRQMQTQLPVPGGFSTVLENYDFGDGQPGPVVVGMLSALPVELPMFVGGRSGGEQTFSYDAFSGPTGKRDVSDVGFSAEVKQAIRPVKLDKVKDLVPAEYSRDLEVKPLAEVEIHSPERDIRQIWQASQPWPVYSSNGSTVARLVKVTPAKSDK